MSFNWSAKYQAGETPWEKGAAHPELSFLLSKHVDLFKNARRILVPGCGFGHDAYAISEVAEGDVVGLDIAPEAIQGASSLHPQSSVEWRLGDFFAEDESFDLIFEHTCFCAIPLECRLDYRRTVSRLIPSGGYLVGIFFPNPDHEADQGPPFGIEMAELRRFFEEDFELQWSREPQQTFEGREGVGRELAMVWCRK